MPVQALKGDNMTREQQILACSGVLYPPADWQVQ